MQVITPKKRNPHDKQLANRLRISPPKIFQMWLRIHEDIREQVDFGQQNK
jgi:hypothetical protein